MNTQKKSNNQASANQGIQAGSVNAEAIAVGKGAKAVVHKPGSITGDEIARAFATLTQKANALPDGPNKTLAQAVVQGLEAEAKKSELATESNVNQWFTSLAQIAPDVFDVALATFINPINGLSTVFQKVAKRAKAEQELKNQTAEPSRSSQK